MASSINIGKQIVTIHPLAEITSTGVSQVLYNILPTGTYSIGDHSLIQSLPPSFGVYSNGVRSVSLPNNKAKVSLREDTLISGNVLVTVSLGAGTTFLVPYVDTNKLGSKLGNNQPMVMKVVLSEEDNVVETTIPLSTLLNYKVFYLMAYWKQDLEAGNLIFSAFELRRIDSLTTETSESPYKDLPKDRSFYDPVTKTGYVVLARIVFQPVSSGQTTIQNILIGIDWYVGSTSWYPSFWDILGSNQPEFFVSYQYASDMSYLGSNLLFLGNNSRPGFAVSPVRGGLWVGGRFVSDTSKFSKFVLPPLPPNIDPSVSTIPSVPWNGGDNQWRFDYLSMVDYINNSPVWKWQTTYSDSADPSSVSWQQDGSPVLILRRRKTDILDGILLPQHIIRIPSLSPKSGPRRLGRLRVEESLVVPVET